MARPWTAERAEEHLLGLELFGMRFGLDRMRRLLTAMGSPQRAFRAVHIVGTNGKSSTVRYAASILEAHGVRTGSYLSPHLTRFAERVRIGDADLPAGDFGPAVQRAAAAAEKVDRTLAAGDRVTQFELLTAAALGELARRRVEVAVVEAGLGGRHDATNVLDAPVVALTNVGLEHTRWLGPTIRDIAREKLAVVRTADPPATLVHGPLDPEAAEEAAALGVPTVAVSRPLDAHVARYQRLNAAVAAAAAGQLHGALDPAVVRRAVEATEVPGRFQSIGTEPPTLADGAHNPAGMAALVAALPPDTPVTAVVSILDDKDAGAMLRVLLPRCAALVCTSSSNPRALSPATLASLAAQIGGLQDDDISVEADPWAAVRRARALGRPVVATGSIYLVADLVSSPGARSVSAL